MNNNSSTGRLLFGDPLAREGWSKEGALKGGKTSFWRRFTGSSFNKPIRQTHGLQTGHVGNQMTYDFDGFYAQEPIHGQAQISGTGGNDRKFSCQMSTRQFHNSKNIGSHWDLSLIDSVELRKLSAIRDDLYSVRTKVWDQAKFDCAMGFFEDDQPTHCIMPGGKAQLGDIDAATCKPSLALLEHIAHSAITGEDLLVRDETLNFYDNGAWSLDDQSRPGLRNWHDTTSQAEQVEVIDLCVDWYFIKLLNEDPEWRKLYGILDSKTNNPLFQADIGGHKNIRLHRMPLFQGKSSMRELHRTSVEAAGMRRLSKTAMKWTGEDGYTTRTGGGVKEDMIGVAFILGAGAMVSHSALDPVKSFTIEKSNHEQSSEAAIHYYGNIKRTRLFEHNGDYHMRKMAGYDLGLINVYYYATA